MYVVFNYTYITIKEYEMNIIDGYEMIDEVLSPRLAPSMLVDYEMCMKNYGFFCCGVSSVVGVVSGM